VGQKCWCHGHREPCMHACVPCCEVSFPGCCYTALLYNGKLGTGMAGAKDAPQIVSDANDPKYNHTIQAGGVSVTDSGSERKVPRWAEMRAARCLSLTMWSSSISDSEPGAVVAAPGGGGVPFMAPACMAREYRHRFSQYL
jgi:hypothetical protein